MIVETGWLASLRCVACGGEVMMIAPGDNDDVAGPLGLLIRQGVPMRGWCLACAQRRGWIVLDEAATAA
jgi:sulfur relay (sulfurtransferase) complex TusBCD TusD component (DsrE family)